MSPEQRLTESRVATAVALKDIASDLEAGRAATPFQHKLAELARPRVDLPVRAAILATDADALHPLLSEIVGHDYKVCKVVVPSRLGYSEILLQERGFILDSGAGPREFADVASFLGALEASHALPTADADSAEPLRFKLMGPAQLNGLCLLVPHSLDALLRKPALLSTLTDQADWVFLAGAPEATIGPASRQAAQLILDHVTGLQNVLVAPATAPEVTTVPATASSSPAASEPWHKGWRVTLSLGLVRIGGASLRQRLALLTAPDSELRRYLVEVRLWRQLDATLQLMDEELAQALRSLGNRLHLGREGLLTDAGPSDLRKTAETLRARLAEEGESLLKSAEREAKAALSPDGDTSRRLREAALALTVDDIEQTPGEVTIKLTLAGEATRRLSELVVGCGQTRLATQARQLREGFECSVRDAEAALEKATGLRHRLAWELPDETALAATLVSSRPELRYRGEMPRPTLASRFGSARSMVMGLMIAGTLVGGVSALTGDTSPGSGGGARTLIAAIMLPMLIVGFLWTYVSFRKQERLTLAKELEKLHEGVATELRRVLADTFRDQQAALADALQKSQRTVQTQIEAALEKTQQLRQRETEELRKRQTEQQRSAEQRSARLRQFSQQLAALRPRLAEAQKLQQQWLAAWIERFNQGKA
jgi:hypothetical protein